MDRFKNPNPNNQMKETIQEQGRIGELHDG